MENELPKRKANSSSGLAVSLVVLVVAWVLMRLWAQAAVDQYNKCYMSVYSNTQNIQNSLVSQGYSRGDATWATFDNYADQVNYCSKGLPPGWIILITGVQARSTN